MNIPRYRVSCESCGVEASLKIASSWTNGDTTELKTYAIVCPTCLPAALRGARNRHAACAVASGERVELPAVFELAMGRPSHCLLRRADLE
ncbi:MAG: hypothetical protein NTV55_10735 [Planctomycetota bacterium]|nr:hypothetical protein [Planctomycetota bacterium]